MTLTSVRFAAFALALVAVAPQAQTFATPDRAAPFSTPDLARRAAGGTVVALPTLDSPFLGNPAHIARGGFSLNVLGVAAGVGGDAGEAWDFYNDELGPAIEEGLDQIREDDPERLAALYARALDIGGRPKTTDLAVHAPSVRLAFGNVGVGAALYAQSTVRGQLTDAGGIPAVDLYGQADLALPVVAGMAFDATPVGDLNVGASATFLQRRVTAKTGPIDSFDPDAERLYLFEGTTVRLAAGAFAQNVVVPGLDVGAQISNVGGAIDYEYEQSIVIEGEGSPEDQAEIAALQARFDGRDDPDAVVRLGVAYRPFMLDAMPGISDTAVALDYTSASTGSADQSLQAGLRLGARTRLAGLFEVRAGVSQGMPSAGIGLVTRFMRLGYATYGVEDGRLLGQQRRRNHVVQLRFGWY